MNTVLMKGNEALVEGAIRGGCRFYAGYPITPQTEILEKMSFRQKDVGGVFIQGESEIASISMVMAASALGARAMTSSSGPGFSLKQEGIAYIVSAGLPAVIVCVQRFGIGDGYICAGQDNYWQVCKGGGNGDYKLIVLAPNCAQENVDMAYNAFELSEKYMIPVVILSDAGIGQMMEPCVLPEPKSRSIDDAYWALKGCKPGETNKVITDCTYFQEINQWNKEYIAKMREIQENEQNWESISVGDAELVFVAYGITSRIAEGAVKAARTQGIKLGLIRPITLWPFPRKAFEELSPDVKALVTVELNMMGQMREDVILASRGKIPAYTYAAAQIIPEVDELVNYAKDVLAGKIKEEEVF